MKRKEIGRAKFYTRDSGGKHEMTPGEYVGWAQREADKLELTFDGTPSRIEQMMRDGQPNFGDLFFDFGVQGNVLSRPALNALIETATNDLQVSHVLIPRRDRLARPDDPMDGVELENRLRRIGLTLVYMDRTVGPMTRGKRPDIAESIVSLVDFDRSGEFRRDLAGKIIFAQIRLAKRGYSTGGRPPYGFRRWLVHEDGTLDRQLDEGEHVRKPGHHVVWLPGPEEEWVVIRRILGMLESMPASRVAATLTAEGVPSPDAGRYRTDGGVKHRVSGAWHQTTVTNIARNPLLLAVCTYGRRSMGDTLRYTPTGPRELEDGEFLPDEKPKVVRNPEADRIVAPASFEPQVDLERHQRLLVTLDERGGTQRGKPRSRDPDKNPLGGRVFDMNCGWPMYRTPYGKTFKYKCGAYMQTHGQQCASNPIDGPTATKFLLACVQQKLFSPRVLDKLKGRIAELASADRQTEVQLTEIARKRQTLTKAVEECEQAKRNLGRAKNDKQYDAIAEVFDEVSSRVANLENEIDDMEAKAAEEIGVDSSIDGALRIIDRLDDLANASGGLKPAGEIFRLVNAQMFLRFQPKQVKKRKLNKLMSGVVTFGDAAPPIKKYAGATARNQIKKSPTPEAGNESRQSKKESGETHTTNNGVEDKSIGKINRGDSRCTFVNEISGTGLVLSLLPETIWFPGDALLEYVTPGLYTKRR